MYHLTENLISIMRSFLIILLFTLSVNAKEKITIFAAASLKDSLDKIATSYKIIHPETDIVISYASSGVLARQIIHGARADIFVSAHQNWIDYLVDQDIIVSNKIRSIIENELVVTTSIPVSTAIPVTTTADMQQPWQTILRKNRFSMGDPTHVPAGIYAKQALQNISLWPLVRKNAIFSENVRVALRLISQEEVGAAILYKSDVLSAENVMIAHTFDQKDHAPIIYWAANISHQNQSGAAFTRFLLAQKAQQIFKQSGFKNLLHDMIYKKDYSDG